MQLDVEALQQRDAGALKELMALCRECSRIGTSKVGAGSFSDDVAQDMILFVLDRFLTVYDGVRDVEPFLIEVARRMGLGYYRKHSREPTLTIFRTNDDSFDPIEMMADAFAPLAETILVEDEQAKLAADAKAALIQRMRDFAKKAARPKPAPALAACPPAAPPKRRYSGKEQAIRDSQHQTRQIRSDKPAIRELVAIRKRMGLTQEQMALALKLSPNGIRSIEYGVVDGRPEELVILAREIERAHGNGVDARESVAELMRRWCLQLKLAPDDSIGLAKCLGVHRTTVFRWRTGRSQPPPHEVRLLNAIVEAMADD